MEEIMSIDWPKLFAWMGIGFFTFLFWWLLGMILVSDLPAMLWRNL
jgi:hypothetical protein